MEEADIMGHHKFIKEQSTPKAWNNSKEAHQEHGEQNIESLKKLGLSYFYGKGVREDEKKGIELLQMAATQGDAYSQLFLGRQYECGVVVDANEKEAAQWYCKAAEQGDVEGQYYMGRCYFYGIGVKKISSWR